MTPSKKYAAIVDRLYTKTSENGVDWNLVNGNVSCELGDFFVIVTSSRNAEGEPFEHLEFKDENYHQIEKFSDADLVGFRPPAGSEEFENYYMKMKSLREDAYRQAVGADEAIDSILKFLE